MFSDFTNSKYLFAIAVFIVSWALLYIVKHFLITAFAKYSKNTENDFDDLLSQSLQKLSTFFYVYFSAYISISFVELSDNYQKYYNAISLIIFSYYVILVVQEIVKYFANKYIQKKITEDESFDSSPIKVLTRLFNGALWGVVIIFTLDNLGYNVGTLVAGIGIGGIAIAFALQNVLSDFLSYFSIYFDKPFQKGDFIQIGEYLGSVKHIGIKTTRLESLQGEEIVVSNQELTTSKIHNYKKMEKRRISFSFGILYETPVEKVKKVPSIVKEIIDSEKNAEFDRAHFKNFGDSSLNFEVVYYMKISDYNAYMDTQQNINTKLMTEFEKEKIEFAYPTQTLFIKK